MEDLISIKTAKLAQEKGFNIPTLFFYFKSYNAGLEYILVNELQSQFGKIIQSENHNNASWILSRVSAPTQSLLQKWLREVHNCFIDILPHRDGDSKNKQWKNKEDVFWTVEVDYYGKNFEIELTDDSDFTQHFNKTYEEALEIGLYQALKLIK